MLEEPGAGDGAGPSPVSPEAYRRAMAGFATGVAVATTRAGDVDYAMTVTAFTSVSLEPPLVLVCVEKRARFHDAVLRSGTWAISVLARGSVDVSDRFATRGRRLDGQLDGIAYERGVTGVAVLLGALARLECRTWATYEGGDHTIVVGEVVVAAARADGPAADAADDLGERSGADIAAPLVHFRGAYGSFAAFTASHATRHGSVG